MLCCAVQGSTQGPHSTSQLQKWMDFLTHSQDPEHKQACAEFRSVAVYKKGMAMKVTGGGGRLPACVCARWV